MQDPDKLNDDTTYQLCFACGRRNEHGLRLTFRRDGDRITAEFQPQESHQGFPGVVHGGIVATLLDETLGRTGALRREWLMTARLDVRYRRPGPVAVPVRVWAERIRERAGAVEAKGAVELLDGTVIADARGVFFPLPDPVAAQALARYPEFANYWQPSQAGYPPPCGEG